jgi:hypothetical protein
MIRRYLLILILFLLPAVLAGCGDRETPTATSESDIAIPVNNLRLNLVAGESPTGNPGATPLTVELEKIGDEVRVIPGQFCGMVQWWMFVRYHVRTEDGQRFHDNPGEWVADVESVHPHSPLRVYTNAPVRRPGPMTIRNVLNRAGVPQELRTGDIDIWVEFEATGEDDFAYFDDGFFPPAAPPTLLVPGDQAPPEMTHDAFRQAVDAGDWPTWAWRGKLTSNTIRLSLGGDAP